MTAEQWLDNNPIAVKIWYTKYRNGDETFEQWLDRVSGFNPKIRQLILDKKFLFGGRTLANRGLNKGSYANCYSHGFIGDTLEEIMQANTDLALTYRVHGGQGLSVSKIRPKGTPIGTRYQSDGIIPFMKLFNQTTDTISQGGSRKGALMMSCDVWHKQIEDFITVKSNEGAIEKANLSVEIDDEFMSMVDRYIEHGEHPIKHIVRDYNGHIVEYDVDVAKIYDLICDNALKHAEPGIIFTNKFRHYNLMQYVPGYNIETSNPCFHPDTIVETVEGPKRIADITEPTYVYSMDGNENLCIKRASAAFKTKRDAQTLKITLRCGTSIQVTPDHKLYVMDKGYKRAADLVIGDRIAYLLRQRRGRRYTGTKLTTESAYRMEHRFVYEGIYGKLEDNMDVHHIDGDTFNNTIFNLEAIPHDEHARLTATEQNPQTHQVHNPETGKFIPNGNPPAWKETTAPPNTTKFKSMYDNAVVKIEDGDITDVYDIQVEDTHSLIANGMVAHNCGEQPLPPHGACNLCSINLYKYVTNPFTDKAKINWDELREDLFVIIGVMDDLIDENYPNHALKEQAEMSRKYRNIGIGFMGFADMLIALRLKYDFPEAIKMAHKVAKFMFKTSVYASAKLGEYRGNFPGYDPMIWKSEIIRENFTDEEIIELSKHNHLRNCSLLSIAPTGLD